MKFVLTLYLLLIFQLVHAGNLLVLIFIKKINFNFVYYVEKPQILPLIKSVDLLERNTFALSCNILTGNKPFIFQWFKNNQQFKDESRHKIDTTENLSILTLKNLTKTDSGTYKCQVNNAFGTDSSSSLINIKGFFLNFTFIRCEVNLVSLLKCGANGIICHLNCVSAIHKSLLLDISLFIAF